MVPSSARLRHQALSCPLYKGLTRGYKGRRPQSLAHLPVCEGRQRRHAQCNSMEGPCEIPQAVSRNEGAPCKPQSPAARTPSWMDEFTYTPKLPFHNHHKAYRCKRFVHINIWQEASLGTWAAEENCHGLGVMKYVPKPYQHKKGKNMYVWDKGATSSSTNVQHL
eukprot:1160366-Pelagomonas_calceolata.AAC.11